MFYNVKKRSTFVLAAAVGIAIFTMIPLSVLGGMIALFCILFLYAYDHWMRALHPAIIGALFAVIVYLPRLIESLYITFIYFPFVFDGNATDADLRILYIASAAIENLPTTKACVLLETCV